MFSTSAPYVDHWGELRTVKTVKHCSKLFVSSCLGARFILEYWTRGPQNHRDKCIDIKLVFQEVFCHLVR